MEEINCVNRSIIIDRNEVDGAQYDSIYEFSLVIRLMKTHGFNLMLHLLD